MLLIRSLIFFICLGLLSGCGTAVRITVDSISDSRQPLPGKEYIMVSGMTEIPPDDLYFREFSNYFRELLAQKGYIPAGRDEADLEISLSYGISEGKNVYFTYDRPIYDFIGGETIVYTSTRRDEEGKITKTTERVHIPTRHSLIGYTTETATKTIYTSFAVLEAKKVSEEGKKMTLWKTTMRHTSEINDLRVLMPYFAAAALPYIGDNTRMAQTVKLKPSDPIVEEMQLLKQN